MVQENPEEFMKRVDEHEKIILKQQESISETREMLWFLVKEHMKMKEESSSRSSCIPRKDKEKGKEIEPHTPTGSTGGEEHDEEDNHSKYSRH